jgi:hypothetical protein
MMFHGAYCGTEGGQQALEDQAALLNKINADAMTLLVSKYDIDPDTVGSWFAEGRMGWLDSAEMIETGIAGEVIGDPAEEITFPEADMMNLSEHGLDIAALLEHEPVEEESTEEVEDECDDPAPENSEQEDAPEDVDAGAGTDEPDGEGNGEAGEVAPEDEPEPDPVAETTDDSEVIEEVIEEPADELNLPAVDILSADYAAGAAAGRAQALEEYAEQVEALTARLDEAQSESRKHQSAYDKAQADIVRITGEHDAATNELRIRLEEATERAEKFLAGSLTFSPTIETWADAMAAHDGDYAKARAAHPDLYQQYMAAARQNGGK